MVLERRYTARQVLATDFGWDINDLEEYRYHYGHTDKPVYAIGQEYYCSTPEGKPPAKHRSGAVWGWKPKQSTFANSIGWIIWRAVTE